MKDRVPVYPGRVVLTPVSGQQNTYDMTRADQPTQDGTPLNKASLLKDATAALFDLGSDAVPDDMLNALAHTGDLHVWKRTQNGQVDYPVSPNPNAYQEGSDEQPAGYTLGEVVTDKNFVSVSANNGSANLKVANSITVLNDGTIDTSNFSVFQSISIDYLNPEVDAKKIAGKFFVIYSLGGSAGYPATSELSLNTVYYAPPDVSLTYIPWSSSHPQKSVVINKFQQVTGYPAIPANTTIEYLGQIGSFGSRIVTGSYSGTGSVGGGGKCILSFDKNPDLIILYSTQYLTNPSTAAFGFLVNTQYGSEITSIGYAYTTSRTQAGNQIYLTNILGSFNDGIVSWYGANTENQLNQINSIYEYVAIFL